MGNKKNKSKTEAELQVADGAENNEIATEPETSEHTEAASTRADAGADADADSATKRKNPFADETKPPKRIKKKKTAAEEPPAEATHEGSDNVLPTAPLSKRQKKKQKKLLSLVKSKDKEVEKAIAYLSKWDSDRDEWKYEKLRQIFLQKHVLDEKVIDDEHSELAIKYLATSKGHARKVVLDAAEAIIKSIEDKLTDENRDELLNSSGYRRARELMQSMQD